MKLEKTTNREFFKAKELFEEFFEKLDNKKVARIFKKADELFDTSPYLQRKIVDLVQYVYTRVYYEIINQQTIKEWNSSVLVEIGTFEDFLYQIIYENFS